MPVITCPVCTKPQVIPGDEWNLISQMKEIVCSRRCAFTMIEKISTNKDVLKNAVRLDLGTPNESHSQLLGMFFRSNYEKHVAEAFSESGMPFFYEKYSFEIKPNVFWTPDFYLPVPRVFIEVKGKFGISGKTKIKLFKSKFPQVPLILFPWTIHKEFYPDSDGEEIDEIC